MNNQTVCPNNLKIVLPNYENKYNIDDLRDFIVNNYEVKDKDVIEKWHKNLIAYLERDNPIFFIRSPDAHSNAKRENIRRGYFTQVIFEKKKLFRYIYIDNFFSRWVLAIAQNSIVFDGEIFEKWILNKELPYAKIITSDEKKYRFLNKLLNISGDYGYKVAHIAGVNVNEYIGFIPAQYSIKETFSVTGIEDWNNKENIRTVEINDRKIFDLAKAHFIRLVHPINLFWYPSNVGAIKGYEENPGFLNKLCNKKNENYSAIWNEFVKISLYNHTVDLLDSNINFIPQEEAKLILKKKTSSHVIGTNNDSIIYEIRKKNNRSWINLRMACLYLLNEQIIFSTSNVKSSSISFANKVHSLTGMSFKEILEWLDNNKH